MGWVGTSVFLEVELVARPLGQRSQGGRVAHRHGMAEGTVATVREGLRRAGIRDRSFVTTVRGGVGRGGILDRSCLTTVPGVLRWGGIRDRRPSQRREAGRASLTDLRTRIRARASGEEADQPARVLELDSAPRSPRTDRSFGRCRDGSFGRWRDGSGARCPDGSGTVCRDGSTAHCRHWSIGRWQRSWWGRDAGLGRLGCR